MYIYIVIIYLIIIPINITIIIFLMIIYIVYYNYIYNIYNRMITSFRKISVLLELTGCRTGKSCHLGHLGMHHVTVAFQGRYGLQDILMQFVVHFVSFCGSCFPVRCKHCSGTKRIPMSKTADPRHPCCMQLRRAILMSAAQTQTQRSQRKIMSVIKCYFVFKSYSMLFTLF